MTQHTTSRIRLLRWALLALFAGFVLAACGGVDESTATDEPVVDGPEPVVFEEPRIPGEDPFTVSVVTRAADEIMALPDDDRPTVGPGLYGGTGDNEVCDRDQLAHSLATLSAQGSAWAAVRGIDVDDIDDEIAGLTPAILASDTRVTNHGFDGSRATPFQSTLAAGTAVLVDKDGKPVTRCACGNPLDEPAAPTTHTTTPEAPQTSEVAVDQPADEPAEDTSDDPTDEGEPPHVIVGSFCDTWDRVRVDIEGGPTGPGEIAAYLVLLRDSLAELISSAEATPGFPEDALTDLIAYHAAIAAAVEAGGVPEAGDVALRDRVEAFLLEYCDEPQSEGPGEDDIPEGQQPDDEPASGNCGSMQFFLLVAAADGVGLDHSTISEFYLQALQDVLAGADPGEEFDVGDLAPMIAYEEVGCAGAQAMQQLFDDNGLGHLIEGTELDG